MGEAVHRGEHALPKSSLRRAWISEQLVEAPAASTTRSDALVRYASIESASHRVDVCRLFAALLGLTLYVGVPAGAFAWLVGSFVSQIGF